MSRFIHWVGLVLCVVPVAAHAADTAMPRIIHEACSQFEKGQAVTILARFEDESQLFDPKVIYRTRSRSPWKHAAFTQDGEIFRVVLPAREIRGRLQYFIEVFDEYGNGPARVGSPDNPIKLVPVLGAEPCQQIPTPSENIETTESMEAVMTHDTGLSPVSPPTTEETAPPSRRGACSRSYRPLYCEAWLWGIVGGIVATGIGVGVYFATADNGREPTPSSPEVHLSIRGPNPTGVP